VKQRLREAGQPFAQVLRSANLRRLQLALLGSFFGHWGYTVALLVYAYRAGGTGLVAVAGVLRVAPSAIVGPYTGVLIDRLPRRRVLVSSEAARAGVIGIATALVAIGAPAATVLVAVAANSALSSAFRPTVSAMLPSLTRTPEELVAANVVSSSIESVAMLAGPALGAIVLSVASVQVVFAITAAALVWSAALSARLDAVPEPRSAGLVEAGDRVREALEGVRAIRSDRRLVVLVALFTGQTLVAGAVAVLTVVVALRLLSLGQSGVGVLNVALGAGAVLGGLAAAGMTAGGRRLASGFALGMLLWGAPLLVIAALPHEWVALLMLAVTGVANTLGDVTGFTLLQRAVAERALGRVFALLESLLLGSMALGGVLIAPIVAGLGTRGALLVAGAFLPLMTALAWPSLRSLDVSAAAPSRERLDLLRALSIFAPLPAPTLEALAFRLEPVAVPAGETVFEQGQPGDRFFIIASGRVEVLVDGHRVRVQGPGEAFGEIALLRDVPRTATVRALEPLELLALGREDFIGAVTGHAQSATVADSLIGARLAHARPTMSSV
jgi:MFS family permease